MVDLPEHEQLAAAIAASLAETGDGEGGNDQHNNIDNDTNGGGGGNNSPISGERRKRRRTTQGQSNNDHASSDSSSGAGDGGSRSDVQRAPSSPTSSLHLPAKKRKIQVDDADPHISTVPVDTAARHDGGDGDVHGEGKNRPHSDQQTNDDQKDCVLQVQPARHDESHHPHFSKRSFKLIPFFIFENSPHY